MELLGVPISTSRQNFLINIIGIVWIIRRFLWHRIIRKNQASITNKNVDGAPSSPGVPKKPSVYSKFTSDLKYLVGICFPSWTCQEAHLCYMFGSVLLVRTLLSLVVAEVDGYMVKQLINRDKKLIIMGISYWLAMAIPSSLINALIKYMQSRLALALRQRLNAHIQQLYFSNDAYYKLSHHLVALPESKTTSESTPVVSSPPTEPSSSSPSSPVRSRREQQIQYPPNTEQAVTEGITQWSDRFADVISSLGKPLFDVTLFTMVLTRVLGWRNQLLASIAVWESSELIAKIRPNFSQMVQERNALESRLRGQYTRVVTNSEEIAFYRGEKKESALLAQMYDRIVDFTKRRLYSQAVYSTIEDFCTKYLWIVIGLIQVAVPLLQGEGTAGENAKYFISVRRVMTRGGDATERLIQGVKDVGELAGYTRNLMNTIDVLKFLNEKRDLPVDCDVKDSEEEISVANLPLITPTGDVLINSMNIQLSRKDRLLILGPNGCGKSTLFRILCGLWNPRGGKLVRPKERTDMLFMPQRPYLAPGTLLEQVIYPLSIQEAEMRRREKHPQSTSLHQLVESLLKSVFLQHLFDLHGLDAEKDWAATMSGGEKQRIGLSRVLFHVPKYAILDECNSTLDLASEEAIFTELCKIEGMGLVTISHRHTLFKFHRKFLTYDGCGGYSFHDTTDAQAVSTMDRLAEEKVQLVSALLQTCKDLGENWPSAAANE